MLVLFLVLAASTAFAGGDEEEDWDPRSAEASVEVSVGDSFSIQKVGNGGCSCSGEAYCRTGSKEIVADFSTCQQRAFEANAVAIEHNGESDCWLHMKTATGANGYPHVTCYRMVIEHVEHRDRASAEASVGYDQVEASVGGNENIFEYSKLAFLLGVSGIAGYYIGTMNKKNKYAIVEDDKIELTSYETMQQ